jgi:cysteine-rich repeat protein
MAHLFSEMSSCDNNPVPPAADKGRDKQRVDIYTPPDVPQIDLRRADTARVDLRSPDASKVDAAPKIDAYKADVDRTDIIIPAGCGDGTRGATEECDDGNNLNLDGCDATCHFEQSHRVNYLLMQFATDAVCTQNAFGGAIGPLAQSMIQGPLDTAIADGSINILFKYLQLDDLTGANDASVAVGAMGGTAVTGVGYDGANDLDWWYTVQPSTIDGKRNPVAQLAGKITNSVLTAGPGALYLNLDFYGVIVPLTMTNTKVGVSIGATSKPLVSTGSTPGHLAAEHLDPNLVSFASAGAKTAAGAGYICGNVSAAGLKAVAIPSNISGYCSEGYTSANSVLDLFVGGCTFIMLQVINPTQPDTDDPSVSPAGGGPPYKLVAGAGKVVNTCMDKNNATVPLQACLADATYSLFLKFASGRVILK